MNNIHPNKVKLTKIKYANVWQVWGEFRGKMYTCLSRNRNKAIRTVRKLMHDRLHARHQQG